MICNKFGTFYCLCLFSRSAYPCTSNSFCHLFKLFLIEGLIGFDVADLNSSPLEASGFSKYI